MSVSVRLVCECGREATVKPYFLLSLWGTYRLQGGTPRGWYIDGNGARCPDHLPEPFPRAQELSWSERDRLHAMADMEETYQ